MLHRYDPKINEQRINICDINYFLGFLELNHPTNGRWPVMIFPLYIGWMSIYENLRVSMSISIYSVNQV